MPILDTLTDFYQKNQGLIFQAIVPFVVIFAVFWGILEMTRLLNGKTRIVLAVAFTLAVFFSPFWLIISTYILNLGAFLAVGMFVLIFIFGTLRWGLGRSVDIYHETGGYEKKIRDLNKKLGDLAEKAARASPNEKPYWAGKIAEVEHDIAYYRALDQKAKGYA
jgi:hypothetical protein